VLGDNDYGQIGNGSVVTDSLVPVTVMANAGQVTVGSLHSCAKTTAGGVKCWGLGSSGQLGNGNSDQLVPTDVPGLLSGVNKVYSGGHHTCAIETSGAVKCWGDGKKGQLGTDSYVNTSVPLAITNLNVGLTSMGLGFAHSCGLTTAGGVKCWGAGDSGQLGVDDTLDYDVPLDVVLK